MNSLSKYKEIHFVGIGGIGMSAIAHVLKKMDIKVSGSDLGVNKNVENLKNIGVIVYQGHSAENIKANTDCVVVTSAVRENNPEVVRAKQRNIPVLRRAQMLSLISNQRNTVAVAGSHGKTTTSCYLAELLQNLDLDPTFMVGGVLKGVDNNAHLGSDLTVIEADESDSSFHYLESKYSIITNIDNDHVDFYGSFEKLKEAFKKFIHDHVDTSIVNFDDQIIKDMITQKSNIISFGSKSDEDYNFKIKKMKFGQSEFLLSFKGEEHLVETNVTGDYNISNLVGAIAYALEHGCDIEKVKKAVKHLSGIKRRYDVLYKSEKRVIIDDYAHHPTEIEKLISAVKMDYPGYKLKVFFEPHRFTRTKNFWDEFTVCFKQSDEFYLFPIYPASEDEIKGINSKVLLKDIINKDKSFISSLDEIPRLLEEQDGQEVVLSLGAGPISAKFREVLNVGGI